MKNIFAVEMRRTRRSLLLWGLVVGILSLFGMLEYPFISEHIGELMPVFATMPKLVMIMFGIYNIDFTSPLGYFVCMYFWCTLLTYAHAVYLGSSILSKDERDNTAEFLFSKPFARWKIVLAKSCAAVANLFAIAVITGVFSAGTLWMTGMSIGEVGAMTVSLLGMFLTQVVFASIGMLCSALCKTYKAGVRTAMGALVVFYAISISIEYVGTVDFLRFLSPLKYFDAKAVVYSGLDPLYLLLAAAVTALSVIAVCRLYERRELFS